MFSINAASVALGHTIRERTSEELLSKNSQPVRTAAYLKTPVIYDHRINFLLYSPLPPLHWFQRNKSTFCSSFQSKTNVATFMSHSAGFSGRPVGTWALYVQGMSSGGEKRPPSVPPPPQVLDAHLATPHTPSGTSLPTGPFTAFLALALSLVLLPLLAELLCISLLSSPTSLWLIHPCKRKRLRWKVRLSLRLFLSINWEKGVPHLSFCSPSLTIKPCFSS